jgi:hypothetical protein
MVSTNGSDFTGLGISGDSEGWVAETLDLADVPELGDVTGWSQVWIALAFVTDYSITEPEGAYVDDIVLRKYVGEGPTETPTCTPTRTRTPTVTPTRPRLAVYLPVIAKARPTAAFTPTPTSTVTPTAVSGAPLPGAWRGDSVGFTVTSNVAHDFTWQGSACGFTRIYVEAPHAGISPSGHFDLRSSVLDVTGDFTSPSTARGSWTVRNSYSFPPCSSSGSWNASHAGE